MFQLRQTLISRQQGPNEAVTHYANEVQALCHRLNIDETEQLHYFIQGLQNNIKRQVLRNQPQNLEHAINFSQAEEAAQKIDPDIQKDMDTHVEEIAAMLANKLLGLCEVARKKYRR